MIGVLLNSNETLTAVLAGAPATTQPYYSLLWRTEGGPLVEEVGQLNGVTDKTLLTGDSAVGNKIIESLLIYNADTSPVVPTINKAISGTSYPRINGNIPVGGTLSWNKQQGITILDASGTTPSAGVGAVVAGIGVVASETGSGNFRKTTLTLTNTPLSITDALAYAGLKLYDFPAGRLRILDAVMNLTVTTTSEIATTLKSGVDVSIGLGSAVATSLTLATTMQNMMPGSGEAVVTFPSSTVINVAPAAVTGFLAAVDAAQLGAILDGTETPIDLFLNLGVAADDIDGNATVVINGTIQLTWINGGDI